jgi:H+-translocating NAD(P) transhydrogenase subunit alpha
MMIAVPKEYHPDERRIPIVPSNAGELVKKGAEVVVESGMGAPSGFSDDQYAAAGASLSRDRAELLAGADVVLRIRKPPLAEIGMLREGCIHVSFLDPFNEKELLETLLRKGVSAVSLEMIPRSTRAQKMDALSSQASLAGYVAVILAAERLDKIFPMMMTPAGTLQPARVFIIGAGVAGLQAIATARRLGARVDVFDTRPEVEEQVHSLGGRFVKIDLGETGKTAEGYAKALTQEQIELQRRGMAKFCAGADVVITTAQVFGRKAPLIVTREMVAGMKPGSIVVDLAVESGGNVEGSVRGETERDGVKLLAFENLPGRVPVHASQMLSSNLTSFVSEFWDKASGEMRLRLEDEIIRGCLVTHEHAIFSETLRKMP